MIQDDMLIEYPMPDGNKLYTKDGVHGVVKGVFACQKVTLKDMGETLAIESYEDGLYSPEDCKDWLGACMIVV